MVFAGAPIEIAARTMAVSMIFMVKCIYEKYLLVRVLVETKIERNGAGKHTLLERTEASGVKGPLGWWIFPSRLLGTH